MIGVRRLLFGLLLSTWVTVSTTAHSASIYVYVNKSGSRLITDHPRTDLVGYTLVKSYGVDDYFGLADRPSTALRTFSARSSQYDDLIISKAEKFGIEPALLKAIVHIESSFNADALSPKGAMGLMQLMPATAQRYGVRSRRDPVESLEGGGRYMRDLLRQFNQDLELALAAYNAGENAVVKYAGIPPYPETRAYVTNVMVLLNKYRQNLSGA
jgi:soluble lytic murein transglycosylase-like protein